MELKSFPIRYEELNDLYTAVDQSCCLNKVPVPLDEELTRSYFLAVRTGNNDGKPFRSLAIEETGRIIGKIELTRHDETTAELDLIIRTDAANQGNGTAALNQLIKQVTADHWCSVIEAYVQRDNEAMKHVLLKNHFVKGRTFQADVVTPVNGSYTLRTVTGEAYVWSATSE